MGLLKTPRNVHRAAAVALLYELDRVGQLDGLSYQDIAEMLNLRHRSTAMRYMRDVQAVKNLLPEIKERLNI